MKYVIIFFVVFLGQTSITFGFDNLELRDRYLTIEDKFETGSDVSIKEISGLNQRFKFLLQNDEAGIYQELNNLINNASLSISRKLGFPGKYSIKLRYIFEQNPNEMPFVVIRYNGSKVIDADQALDNEVTVERKINWFSSTYERITRYDNIEFKTAQFKDKKYLLVKFGLGIYGYSRL